jgi:hypothetical protein
LTFIAVTVAWVLFRAADVDVAVSMLQSMAGGNGVVWPDSGISSTVKEFLGQLGWQFMPLAYFAGSKDLVIIALLLLLVWRLPNTLEIIGIHRPALELGVLAPAGRLAWRPTAGWMLLMVIIAFSSILKLSDVSEFLYFQF